KGHAVAPSRPHQAGLHPLGGSADVPIGRGTHMTHDANCVFCKIIAGQIPSRKAHEDDELLVFHDIAPWAPVHLLMVPKEHVATMYEMTPDHAPLLGRMLAMAPELMRRHGVTNGFRTLINT